MKHSGAIKIADTFHGLKLRQSVVAVSALFSLGLASSAFAQGAPAPAADTEEIVITGTLIRGVTPTGSPVIGLSAKDIQEGGYFNATDVLRSIPQILNLGATDSQTISGASAAALNQASSNGTNLRGLGTPSTLTLLNGHRLAPSGSNGQLIDASSIPSIAISKLEVLLDGSSALYGSDAVAGVVNIKLKNGGDHATTQFTAGGGHGVYQWGASQLFAKAWSTGSVTATIERTFRNHVEATKRPGQFDSNPYNYGVVPATGYISGGTGILSSNPGNILVTTGTFGGVTCSAAAPCFFAIPTNQNGVGLTGTALPTTPASAANNYATANTRNQYAEYTLLPEQKRDTLVMAMEQAITDKINFTGDLLSTKRTFIRQSPAVAANLAIPNSNPYSPCNLAAANRPAYCGATATSTISVPYYFGQYLGPQIAKGYSKITTVSGTLEADLSHDWRGSVTGTWSKNQDDRLNINTTNVNTTNLDRFGLANGTFVNNFNPFIGNGAYSSSNQALVDKIRAFNDVNVTYLVKDAVVRFDGPLFALPAGDLKMAVGAERRTDLFTRFQTGTQLSGLGTVNAAGVYLGFSQNAQDVQTINPPPTNQTVTSAYAEFFVPIIGGSNALPFVQKLDISLAGRSEKNSKYGSNRTPKFGFTWAVNDDFQFNGTYGKSYRAPGLPESDTYQGQPTCFTGTGSAFCAAQTGFDGAALPATQTVLFVGGGNPNLVPETATTKTIGFVVHPKSVPGLDVTLGYYNIQYKNRIGVVLGGGISNILANPLYSPLILAGNATTLPTAAEVTQWLNYINLNTQGLNGGPAASTVVVRAIIDNRVQNGGVLNSNGVDFSARYGWDTSIGHLNAGVSGTLVRNWKTSITPTATVIDGVNTNISTGTSPNPLRLRARGTMGWKSGAYSLNGSVNYTGGYTNNNNLGAVGGIATPQDVASHATLDLNASYEFSSNSAIDLLKNLRIQLNVQNLTDRAPPYVLFYTGALYTKFDPQYANPIGRQITMQVSKDW